MCDITLSKPPLESLACCNPSCEWFGQPGHDNLVVRRVYGVDQIRFLRCRACQSEFSERKGTPLWNCKLREAKAMSIAEHLGDGCGIRRTARLTRSNRGTVTRYLRRLGEHSQYWHELNCRDVVVDSLQADERHGYVGRKRQPWWEAELVDPESRFVLAHVQGPRNETLVRRLLQQGADRLACRHGIVLFTDGFAPYAKLFPVVFGEPATPNLRGRRGRPRRPRYRIPRHLAHVQIIKSRRKRAGKGVHIVYRHGLRRRANEALDRLQHFTPNTSVIERRHATARSMNAFQVRETLGFARHALNKVALGWWTLTLYNWCRPQRILKRPLRMPSDKPVYVVRTPAQALQLADRVVDVQTILRTPSYRTELRPVFA